MNDDYRTTLGVVMS